MRVLVACEYSGTVRDAFRAKGHDAWSCDLLPTEGDPRWHYKGDILDIIDGNWDILIAHPPCTYLCSSGLHWNNKRPGRSELTLKALDFVRTLLSAQIPRIALENPIGCISTKIRPYDQTVQPYEYGHDASKTTCLWLKNLPPLRPTGFVEPRIVNGKRRWANQCDNGGQDKLPPSEDRWKIRSLTYQGIADAMANQWSEFALSSPLIANHAPIAENLFAWSASNTTQTANVQAQATLKMTDGNS